jgi:uncharacterized protein YjaZ
VQWKKEICEMTKFIAHDTTAALRRIVALPAAERPAAIQAEIIAPFEEMFAKMTWGGGNVSAADAGEAYLNAARSWMMVPPDDAGEKYLDALDRLDQANASEAALEALKRAGAAFEQAGVDTRLEKVRVGVFPFPPGHPQIDRSGGYTGFGAIAGYIVVMLWPDEATLPRISPATVHELNHQVRFNYHPMGFNVSVGEYIVAEGLAESFAGELYGSSMVGPWVTQHTPDSLARSREIIAGALDLKGFNLVRSYIFGAPITREMNLPEVGLPAYAGYAVGFHLVQAYLQRTGKSAAAATILPAAEIIAQAGYF